MPTESGRESKEAQDLYRNSIGVVLLSLIL